LDVVFNIVRRCNILAVFGSIVVQFRVVYDVDVVNDLSLVDNGVDLGNVQTA